MIVKTLLFLCIVLTTLPKSSGTSFGIDVSTKISVEEFKCLLNNNFISVTIRCFESTYGNPSGFIDPNCGNSIYNAWIAGFTWIDVYMFPCPKCGNATGQVNTLVKYLSDTFGYTTMVWVDVEENYKPPYYWSKTNTTKNVEFFSEIINALEDNDITIGVYTSKYQWTSIMGKYTGGSPYPLWYNHNDTKPSFDDFTPFGGWTSPASKQYFLQYSICNVGVDLDIKLLAKPH
ncbi:hypothetical protein PPL_07200 [Heterostelium album PN500]|uniref:Lysozyme n=1 Tax=Heterostelium pallidum (strain ATCC 26659 / Pp 5 / PN500) TaxID=670386 RepID=D3BEN5_HETP5|nr:hypothetical protein PPL_07200 [Heterostelium album PN500]EFA80366.1 hypothetical protein PPL_07200 [Heterostelium album PN500]|eukprot:XP_020432486.1 hypothetical protein PPL_07200 [Heterostelium album PN500]